MRPIIAALLLLSVNLTASVRIIENTASRLTFRWEMGALDTTSVSDSGRKVTNLSFSDANIILGEYNEPAIPGYSAFAGIPASGNVRITFTPGAVRTVALGCPVRTVTPLQPGQIGLPKLQKTTFSGGWISDVRYTWLRNLRAAHIVIKPFRYDLGSKTLQVLQSGECTLEFPAAARTTRSTRATDYQATLKRVLLNYDVATGWTKQPVKSLRKSGTGDPYPFGYTQKIYTFKIGDGHDADHEMTTKENGVLKISGSQIKRLFPQDSAMISTSQVALYASWKGALPMDIPGSGQIPAGVVEVPLLRIDRGRSYLVDDNDAFLAYVSGLSDWTYDSTGHTFVFNTDIYGDNRTYWLTLKQSGSGATLSKFTQPDTGGDTRNYFINHVNFKEQPYKKPVMLVNSGIPIETGEVGWVWQCLTPGDRFFRYRFNLPGLDTAFGGTMRFVLFGGQDKDFSITLSSSVSGDSVCTDCQINSDYPVAKWGDRTLQMEYTNLSATAYLQLDHIVVTYREQLSAAADTLRQTVFSFNDSNYITYRMTGAGNRRLYIFRIPPDENGVKLIDTVQAADSYEWKDWGPSGARYFVCNDAGLLTLGDDAFTPVQHSAPSGYFVSTLRDTLSAGAQTDYLIITHPGFLEQAKRLAEHKAKMGFSTPRVVSVTDVYNDFAGGNFDPTAIRNFLAFVTRNWKGGGDLDYAVLMGSGHNDFKQIKTGELMGIPPAEVSSNMNSPGEFCSDDYYARINPDTASEMTLAIGRIPSLSADEATAMVDKIVELEDPAKADWGSWRNSILMVADDDMQGPNQDMIRGDYAHYMSSERVAAVAGGLRPSMDIRKTYLYDYPWTSSWEKPEASRSIINEVNSGVGYVNFFGHGSDQLWTDEHVLSPAELPQFTNAGRYPIFSSYSCSVGEFDKPDGTSLGEAIMKLPGAGASASFASTRAASATDNESLAKDIYAALFDTLNSPGFGMAVIAGKMLHANSNSVIYVLFGDPSLRFVNPTRTIRLEVTDTAGAPHDTLQALQQVRIKGTVVDDSGRVDASFGALNAAAVQVGLYNAAEQTTRKDNGADQTVMWLQPGKPVFSGRLTLKNGTFEQSAILPQNLTFDKSGVRLTAFAWEGKNDALGCRSAIIFHGSRHYSVKDSAGPRITIKPVYDAANLQNGAPSFPDRVVASLPLKCEIVLSDPNGINVMGSGPDEGLTMEIPGVMSRRNINQKFQYAEGDYRCGSAVISFEDKSLKVGKYNLAVTAQDLLGNVSKADFGLEITDDNNLSLDHVFNSPNPMHMGGTTQFFFYPSTQSASANIVFAVKIFSLGGKLLKVIKYARNGETWDGRDQTGYQLPPDIYLYQVTALYPSDKQVKSKIQKIVIHPPK